MVSDKTDSCFRPIYLFQPVCENRNFEEHCSDWINSGFESDVCHDWDKSKHKHEGLERH
jgi:hypothetical protein